MRKTYNHNLTKRDKVQFKEDMDKKAHEPKVIGDAFKTSDFSSFPRMADDNFSSSSEEEKRKRDRLEKLSKIASVPKDPDLLKDYRLPLVS